MKSGRVVAIIPVRKGSQRVKNKNLRPFCDTNLLENKIKSLQKVKEIDEIILNTDSDEAIEIGKKYNLTIHKREDYYASSECNNSDFFQHIAQNTSEECTYLVYTPVTSPFILPSTMSSIINKFMESDFDSVVPVEVIKHHLWMDGKPLNFEFDKAPNTQDLPDVFACNYSCAIISREDQIKYKSLVGKNVHFYPLNNFEAMDIDTMYDFELAQVMYRNQNLFQ